MIIELKSEILINAGIRAAERNFTNAYVTKRGDSEAGAIFVKIDTLDGCGKLFTRNLKYDLINENNTNINSQFNELLTSVNFIIDNKLISEQKKINGLFDVLIEETSLDKDNDKHHHNEKHQDNHDNGHYHDGHHHTH